jgi:hypothetical protein
MDQSIKEGIYDPKAGTLTCPHCGCTDVACFEHVEEILAIRRDMQLEDGLLKIEGRYEVCDENGQNPRICCQAAIPLTPEELAGRPAWDTTRPCLGEFTIPAELELDFV